AGVGGSGHSDAFRHVGGPLPSDAMRLIYRVVSLVDTNPFAKAGLMFRDVGDQFVSVYSADAASVILDVKPSGEVEFMARSCAGCETTYLAGAFTTLPVYLSLTNSGSTYTARVG